MTKLVTSDEWITEKKIIDFLLNSTANCSLTQLLDFFFLSFFGNTLKFRLMLSAAELIFSAVEWSVSYPCHVTLFLFPGWINSVTNQKSKYCSQRESNYSWGCLSSLSNISDVILRTVACVMLHNSLFWMTGVGCWEIWTHFEKWLGTLLQIIWSHPKAMQASEKGPLDFFWDWTRLSVSNAVMWN